jgi:hypothetical protein
MTSAVIRHELRTSVVSSMLDLDIDELRVLNVIAKRLVLGKGQYGALDIDRDPRDWHRELSEELADAMVYLACAELRKPQAQP